MENLYTPDCIRTYTGKYFNVFEPTIDMIDIIDIAHSLSQQCRFGAHLPQFYSVAQHCCLTSELVPDALKLQALLHDASEAYILDFPSPIKKRFICYQQLEQKIMKLIAEKFNIDFPFHPEVKAADECMLVIEWHSIMLSDNEYLPIILSNPSVAKIIFLELFSKYSTM